MKVRVTISGLGAGILTLPIGVNLISGCYIETKPNDGNTPTRLYGVADYLSVGGESSTLIFGHAQTEWMTVESESAKKLLQYENFLGSHVDVEVKGTSFGSSKGDVTLKVIDKIGNAKSSIDKFNIKIDAYQLASTKIRGQIRAMKTESSK
ncbi:hypothetical protein NB545_16455 [Vibrio campbellii]|uniref:hypothetical protein n=1 Tax=Vibrio campbellii TaxID=680 RepID=UPI00215CF081|nr:hypothetical protein [Vibrio campbellii]MCR9909044.1 hypothetical protein [Vibrio campbellii]